MKWIVVLVALLSVVLLFSVALYPLSEGEGGGVASWELEVPPVSRFHPRVTFSARSFLSLAHTPSPEAPFPEAN